MIYQEFICQFSILKPLASPRSWSFPKTLTSPVIKIWAKVNWFNSIMVKVSIDLSIQFLEFSICDRLEFMFSLCVISLPCWLFAVDLKEMSFKKVPNVPGSPALSALLKVSVIGGLGVYAISNSLYNVEGGHRAVMFNRLTGIKEKVLYYSSNYHNSLLIVTLKKKKKCEFFTLGFGFLRSTRKARISCCRGLRGQSSMTSVHDPILWRAPLVVMTFRWYAFCCVVL